MHERQQPAIRVAATVASEPQRHHAPRRGQGFGVALRCRAARIGVPVARRGALRRIDLQGADASETSGKTNVERVAVHNMINDGPLATGRPNRATRVVSCGRGLRTRQRTAARSDQRGADQGEQTPAGAVASTGAACLVDLTKCTHS
jgi:hypothetical protein